MRRVSKNVSRQERVTPRKTDPAAPAEGSAGGAGEKRANRQPPWEKEAGQGESSSFGDWLRRQREMREISLRDIAERTKISLRYLEAMEADRFELLPAPIFAKGFLREYARYVGLSPDDVVNHYLSVFHPEELAEPNEEGKVRPRPRQIDPRQPPIRRSWSYGLVLTIAGLLLLVLVALAVWLVDRRGAEPDGGNQAPSIVAPPPVAVPRRQPPAPEPSAPLEVSLDFSRNCWVEALIDGKKRFAEERAQGETLQLEAQTSILLLKLGNGGAVDIQVNGYPYELEAKEGEVVRDLLIDLETIKALKQKKEAR